MTQRTTPKSHVRPVGTAKRRVSKIASARDSLAGFGPGIEVDVLTYGQFSIIDAIEAVLEQTGPASVDLATWTAAEFDLRRIETQIRRSGITDMRLVVDRSFVARHPKFLGHMLEIFGPGSLRATRIHAKFCVVRNTEWDVVIRTSMNLNFNPRIEYLQVTADAGLADFYGAVVDGLFSEEAEGVEGPRSLPALADIPGVAPQTTLRMGATPKTGPIS